RTPRYAQALSQAAARRIRFHQLTDAVHDEGNLRAVPAAARGPRDRQDELRLLVLQPGPAPRPGGFCRAGRAPETELGAGKTDCRVGRSLPGRSRRPRAPADLGAGDWAPS